MESYDKTSPELCSLFEKLDGSLAKTKGFGEVARSLPDSRWLSTEELCAFLRLTKRTVQRYRDERVIPFTVIGGKFLYPVDRIKQILSNNLVNPL